METLKRKPDLGKLNAFMANHEAPTHSRQTPESTLFDLRPTDEALYPTKAIKNEQPGKIDIPEEMLPYAAALHGL